MDYEKYANHMIQKGMAEEIVPKEHVWDTVSQVVVGLLVEIKLAKSVDNDDFYKWFVMRTNNGLIQLTLGKRQEHLISEDDIGTVLRISYVGKKKANKGSMNLFSIIKIPNPENTDYEEPKEDRPVRKNG
jgi:hypothetical protein